ITRVRVPRETFDAVKLVLPTEAPPKLELMLRFLLSADRALSEEGHPDMTDEQRLAVTRRGEYHRIRGGEGVAQGRGWSRNPTREQKSTWEKVAAALGVSPGLAAALGAAPEDGGQPWVSPDQFARITHTLNTHGMPTPRGSIDLFRALLSDLLDLYALGPRG